jgi:hypothetical protein
MKKYKKIKSKTQHTNETNITTAITIKHDKLWQLLFFTAYTMLLNLLAKTISVEFKFQLDDIIFKKPHAPMRAHTRAHTHTHRHTLTHTTKYLHCYKLTNVLTINISNIILFLVVFASGHKEIADLYAITAQLFMSMHNAKKNIYIQYSRTKDIYLYSEE